MHHIHTSIVSRHLATRGNNKILRTPPPHISSSEERLPRLTRHTLAQLRTNKSLFLLHKVAAKTHPSPLCPLCNIHTHDTLHLFNCTHIRTTLSPLGLWTDLAGVTALLVRWTEKLAGGPQAGTSDSPPLTRVMGVGRQQQPYRKTDYKPIIYIYFECLFFSSILYIVFVGFNKSSFLKSYLHKVDAKSHPSPLCPLCNIHTHDTHHLQLHPHMHHTVTPGFVDRPRWSDIECIIINVGHLINKSCSINTILEKGLLNFYSKNQLYNQIVNYSLYNFTTIIGEKC